MRRPLLTLLLTLGLAQAAPVTAPLLLDLLPYGTVMLSEGRYMIPNYEQRGVDIYIYSPTPLRIATQAEMQQYQAQFNQALQSATLGAAPNTGSPAPASPTGTSPTATGTAPVTTLSPVAPTPLSPVPAATLSPVPAAALAPVPAAALAPVPAAPLTPIPASALLPIPSDLNLSPALGMLPSVTLTHVGPGASLPAFLSGSVTAQVSGETLTLSYRLTNLSPVLSVRLDPATLDVRQGTQALRVTHQGRTTATRDLLTPGAMQLGQITVPLHSREPVTLIWTAQDAAGHLYPLTYLYTPGGRP